MHGLILAAGRGSRMKHMTNDKPKSFNKFQNRRFIDIIIENFLENKINNINLIIGYKHKLFKSFKYKKIFNPQWASTSIFSSLYCANKILKRNTCLISYSDIIYKKNAIKLLKQQKGDIIILSNSNWKKTWNKRFKKPLQDIENFDYETKDKVKYLTKIGAKPKNISSIKGQFSGLFKISPSGWTKILRFIKKENINIKKLDITSFFSKFVKKHRYTIKVVDYKDMWFEVDTIKDLKILNYKKI